MDKWHLILVYRRKIKTWNLEEGQGEEGATIETKEFTNVAKLPDEAITKEMEELVAEASGKSDGVYIEEIEFLALYDKENKTDFSYFIHLLKR